MAWCHAFTRDEYVLLGACYILICFPTIQYVLLGSVRDNFVVENTCEVINLNYKKQKVTSCFITQLHDV